MKRLIPAAVILALIIAMCVISNASVHKSIYAAKSEIKKCETLYKEKNYDMAYKAALEFKNDWRNRVKVISAYSNHCAVDSISNLAAVLPEAVKHRNDFEVDSAISQISVALRAIYKEQVFTFASLY